MHRLSGDPPPPPLHDVISEWSLLELILKILSEQELQYARKEVEVRLHLESIESERQKKLEICRANNTLKECDCCSSEECLDEDMIPWLVQQ